MLEEFKKKLALLLQKYPDLPEFTLKIQPRVVVSTEVITKLPLTQTYPELNYPPLVQEKPKSETKKDADNPITMLEKSVTKKKLEELSKSAHIE